MMKIKYISFIFIVVVMFCLTGVRCYSQVGELYRVSPQIEKDTHLNSRIEDAHNKNIIRPGKWFPVRVEYIGPSPDTANWCFDLWPLLVAAGTPVRGELFPNRAQFTNGVWDGLCYYEPPPELQNTNFSIVIKAHTYVDVPPIVVNDSIWGVSTSDPAIYVYAAPTAEIAQIDVYPNPFGASEWKSVWWGPPEGWTMITVFPISSRGLGDVTMKIYDSFGHLVKTFSSGELTQEQVTGIKDPSRPVIRAFWNGRNGKGHKVSNGVYQVAVRVEETEGHRVYTQKIGVVW